MIIEDCNCNWLPNSNRRPGWRSGLLERTSSLTGTFSMLNATGSSNLCSPPTRWVNHQVFRVATRFLGSPRCPKDHLVGDAGRVVLLAFGARTAGAASFPLWRELPSPAHLFFGGGFCSLAKSHWRDGRAALGVPVPSAPPAPPACLFRRSPAPYSTTRFPVFAPISWMLDLQKKSNTSDR